MSKFAILLGGRLRPTPRLRAQIAGARFIAADSGMIHAETLGVTPELWVGDFNSTSLDLANRHSGIARQEHPAEKAATDGELAIEEAIARGAGEIVLVGGFGGQADHMLGHLGLLLALARRRMKALLTSGNEEAYAVLPGTLSLPLAEGDRVSIIPFADLGGLDIANVRWPLTDRAVPLGSSLTLSNVAQGIVSIALRSGYGVVIAYPRNGRSMTIVTIESMGRRGEGVAVLDGARLYVPFSLPGETIEGEEEGERIRLRALITPSADRIEPFCPYFGGCGGCAIQHWRREPYLAWKRDLVVTALRQHRIEGEVAEAINAGGAGRRRATLHVRKTGDDAKAGYHAARSRDLYPIETCPILEPSMRNVPHIAAEIGMASGSCHVAFTSTGTGLDVHIVGAARRNAAHLARIGNAYELARIAADGEIISERIAPVVEMGRAIVKPPPGGFLQATKAGQDILSQLVVDAVGKAKHVADLFCGLGPFTLRMAETARIFAADSDKPSIAALTEAANRTQGLKPVTAVRRDLFREPLTPRELNAFDVVVFDPPRAGAEAQARNIARSTVKTVVAVSCDPGTFARDAAILNAGGYSLEKVTPVDQFVHSMHVELVGVFRRQSLARST